MPTISYGPPQPRTLASLASLASRGGRDLFAEPGPDEKAVPRELTTVVAGQNVTRKVLRLRGLDDIEQSELPDGAKRLLLMHMGTIAADQSDQYIVNPDLAEEWMRTHPPVPSHIKPPEKKKESQGCSTRHMSWKCVKNEGQQAIDKASEEWENLRREAQRAWSNASDELSRSWEMAEGCFADHTLSLREIPVTFDIDPTMSIPIEGGEMKSSSVRGELSGSVSLGIPMKSDFTAQLELFYIPCLPFVLRPKALSADGSMTVGETLTGTVTATGRFGREFKIPPGGGPSIPIAMLPIVVGGVPVAELDIAAYIEGSVTLAGDGKAEGSFQVKNTNTVEFDVACDGGGCSSRSQMTRDPIIVTESAQLQGQVSVEPAIYTALQLNFNFNALSLRAGPQPYLLAEMAGCIAGAAQQTEGGGSRSSHNEGLMADLDWGVKFRAEALVMGEVVGNPYVKSVTGNRHVMFRDLVREGSTALVAVVDTAPQVTAGKPATYRVRMPSCYPYTTPVQYRISWTGGATARPTEGCDWQRGICKFDPKKDLVIDLTWPAEGSYSLTIVPVGDEHGTGRSTQLRTFEPAPKATELSITVMPEG
ncbi:MAG: hypothetical protein WEA80_01110 [Gemmatimonadaceae bacterium]